MRYIFQDIFSFLEKVQLQCIIGSPSSEPMFSLCRKWRKLPDIEKSSDASVDNKKFSSLLHILMKQNSFLFQATSCHFSVEVFLQIAQRFR